MCLYFHHMQTPQHPYLSRLDHLRFLAASLVVVFHFFHTHQGDLHSANPLVSLIDEGHTGIALFMVISGFIFTVIAGQRDVSYLGFMRNRIIRIYPLFVFAVFLQLFISTYNDQRNYGFLQLLGWLIPFRSDTVPLSPQFVQLWTIWVEFQFYLIFPFLLLFSRRFGGRYLWGLLLLLVVTRALVYAALGSVRYIAYETIFGRLDQFLVGMLVGRLWLAKEVASASGGQARVAHLSPLWLLGAAASLVMGLHLFSLNVGFSEMASTFWIIWPPIEAALWAAFLWTYLSAKWPGPLAWRHKVDQSLAALGAMSFSTYVMHNLVIGAYNGRLPLIPLDILSFAGAGPVTQAILTGALVVLPLVLLVSVLTYRLIERPFLSLRAGYLRNPAPVETGLQTKL